MNLRRTTAIASALALALFSLGVPPLSAVESESFEISAHGPAGRIHGADISRWQHPQSKSINFVKMYKAGLRFVMIKASDSRDESDQMAVKYVATDRRLAQSAGIYTGFYHYAMLPDVSDPEAIAKDARVQAQKAIWRLASLGGYNSMDLPYALDLENNCVRFRANGSCSKSAPRSVVTQWAKVFLATLKEKTGRAPIFYSYPTFLENAMVRDKELRQYPLWMAQYAISPFEATSGPGVKRSGCYVHSWTTSSCSSQWVIWQYTSCGIAPKYGVPGSRLDLNVYRGSQESFLALATGSWVPEAEDLMPQGESTTITLKYLKASTSDKEVNAAVEVLRPDSSPVVTGDIKFVLLGNSGTTKVTRNIFRTTSGQWKISLGGFTAGTWNGEIRFKDVSGTHLPITLPVTFTVIEGTSPSPSPSPTPKPSPTPQQSNGCRNQTRI